jgi:predicted RNA-binding Zn ribbon-like protein
VSDTFQSRQRKDGTFASLGMLATDSRVQIMRFSSAARRHLKRFLDTTRNRTRRWCDIQPRQLKQAVNFYEAKALEVLS